MKLDILQRDFNVEGSVDVVAGVNGLPKVVMTHASGATAEAYLHGAHLTSWKTSDGTELSFLSRNARFERGKPIRGGIPVCFPQFSGQGPLPPHGFVRTREWQLIRTELLDNGAVASEFQITDTAETLALWPHTFALGVRILLDEDSLALDLQVANTGSEPFDFQIALHTYFGVGNVSAVGVCGLEGSQRVDTLRDWAKEIEDRPCIRFASETDSIYPNAADSLRVEDEGRGRSVVIEKRNMPDVVVWNPWIEKSRRMEDYGEDEYLRMVCVESGCIETRPNLMPNERWQGGTRLSCHFIRQKEHKQTVFGQLLTL